MALHFPGNVAHPAFERGHRPGETDHVERFPEPPPPSPPFVGGPPLACRQPRLDRTPILQVRDVRLKQSQRQQPVEMTGMSGQDRKSTRLNSSHVKISYAVF